MSTRTVIEINHDVLADLIAWPNAIEKFLWALSSTEETARRAAPNGIRILGQRHHSETLKLTVK